MRGVAHVYDSRSLAYVDGIREQTNGRGVDVVLNSLGEPHIREGLSCSRPVAFVEIGKLDLYRDTSVGLGAFADNVLYSALDLDRHFKQRPDDTARLFAEIMPHVASGALPPLPVETFAFSRIGEALSHMAQARHTGKVILVPTGTAQAHPRPSPNVCVPIEVI